MSVLIVDDDADASELARLWLEEHGARVHATSSVPAAIDALAAAVPDVLVLDLAMPDVDGYELIRRVRRLNRRPATPRRSRTQRTPTTRTGSVRSTPGSTLIWRSRPTRKRSSTPWSICAGPALRRGQQRATMVIAQSLSVHHDVSPVCRVVPGVSFYAIQF